MTYNIINRLNFKTQEIKHNQCSKLIVICNRLNFKTQEIKHNQCSKLIVI